MLTTMLYDFSNFPLDQKTKISGLIEKMKVLFHKKKALREEKYKLRGKLLMDKQILEEQKRRHEENNAYYTEQIDEIKEQADKKDSFIKQFEKKFNEVEIYVQREAKNNSNNKWDQFLDFEIIKFIEENENMQRKKSKTGEEIITIEEDIKEILRENVELKKRDEYIDISDDYDSKKSKYKSLIKIYKAKIKFMERNSEHLRNVLNKLNCKLDNITNSNQNFNEKLKIKDDSKYSKYNSKNLSYKKPKLQINIEEGTYDTFNNKKNSEQVMNTYEDKNFHITDANEEHDINDSKIKISINDSDVNVDEDLNSSQERDNEKSVDQAFQKRKYSLVEEPSGIRTPEFNLKQENWDISCIENFTES
jgi:hypothetical protein